MSHVQDTFPQLSHKQLSTVNYDIIWDTLIKSHPSVILCTKSRAQIVHDIITHLHNIHLLLNTHISIVDTHIKIAEQACKTPLRLAFIKFHNVQENNKTHTYVFVMSGILQNAPHILSPEFLKSIKRNSKDKGSEAHNTLLCKLLHIYGSDTAFGMSMSFAKKIYNKESPNWPKLLGASGHLPHDIKINWQHQPCTGLLTMVYYTAQHSNILIVHELLAMNTLRFAIIETHDLHTIYQWLMRLLTNDNVETNLFWCGMDGFKTAMANHIIFRISDCHAFIAPNIKKHQVYFDLHATSLVFNITPILRSLVPLVYDLNAPTNELIEALPDKSTTCARFDIIFMMRVKGHDGPDKTFVWHFSHKVPVTIPMCGPINVHEILLDFCRQSGLTACPYIMLISQLHVLFNAYDNSIFLNVVVQRKVDQSVFCQIDKMHTQFTSGIEHILVKGTNGTTKKRTIIHDYVAFWGAICNIVTHFVMTQRYNNSLLM